MSLSDGALLEQFETLTLPPAELDHSSHLRIAWLYLRHTNLETAIEKVAAGTRAYAENLGDYDKFHHTVTEATVRIMNKRMKGQDGEDFESFINGNPDLVTDLKSLLETYYSSELLSSASARSAYTLPDRRAL